MTLNRCVDTNWYEGTLNGRQGHFPVSFVEQLVDGDLALETSPLPLSREITEILIVSIYCSICFCSSSACLILQQDAVSSLFVLTRF